MACWKNHSTNGERIKNILENAKCWTILVCLFNEVAVVSFGLPVELIDYLDGWKMGAAHLPGLRLHIMLGLVIVSNLPFLQSLDSMGSEEITPSL